MSSKPWYEIIRKDPFSQKEDKIAYLRNQRDTSMFKSKNNYLPIFIIEKTMNPEILEKIVLNKKGKIIASFQEGDYLTEYFNKYEKAKRIVSKKFTPKLKPEISIQLRLFP